MQVPLQDAVQLVQLHPDSAAFEIKGALANAIAPRIGSAPFAAFLKNSLLDWSSSFFLFFITFEVLKDAYELPSSALILLKVGNKKDVGVNSSVPIPIIRLSHCLQVRISNASQPTPSDIIHNTSTIPQVNQVVDEWSGYNPPTRTLQLHYLCEVVSKLRSLKITDSNVRKRPFSFSQSLTNGCLGLRISSMLNDPPCPKTGLIGCKNTKKN